MGRRLKIVKIWLKMVEDGFKNEVEPRGLRGCLVICLYRTVRGVRMCIVMLYTEIKFLDVMECTESVCTVPVFGLNLSQPAARSNLFKFCRSTQCVPVCQSQSQN